MSRVLPRRPPDHLAQGGIGRGHPVLPCRCRRDPRTTPPPACPGELDAAQREQLLAAAGRCPVHRLLTKDIAIVTVPARPAEPEMPTDVPPQP
ncbi:hypothetical protein C6Y14_41165 [Streptomyces dioscori]|uniref:Uncharacterized protein n=1 Tax=Streptomyces dioscori TaxID=2109333 RepID=A0A2P8PU95_9ACTN|nr:hypothetical protein C6Y14_41165 [Streptomyces dioscori]